MSLTSNISALTNSFTIALERAESLEELENIKISFLGRNGSLQELFKGLSDIPSNERPQYGKEINLLKKKLC